MSTRSDAWEAKLPAETAKELYRLTKCPTEEEAKAGRPWLRDFDRDVLPHLSMRGIVAPSRAGWYRFLQRMRIAEAEQTRFSVEAAKLIAEGVVAAHIDAKLAADYLTAKALDASTDPRPEGQKAASILAAAAAKFHTAALGAEKLKLETAAQKTKGEQLKLAREKFEAAERRENAAKAAVADNKLSDEERMAKLREIYGI